MFSLKYPGEGRDVCLHNHSCFSDGSNTVEEMCRAAKQKGMTLFGMSDHFVMRPWQKPCDWGMSLQKAPAYLAEIGQMKSELEDGSFRLLAGLEVDFFPENFEELRTVLDRMHLDYCIGSCHYLGDFCVDVTPEAWQALSQREVDETWAGYWQNILLLVKTGYFPILGHLDLPKKFCFYPSGDQREYITEILRAVKAAGMILEVNTAGLDKDCREPYPSAAIRQQARQMEIPMIFSSDSHCVKHIGRHYEEVQL